MYAWARSEIICSYLVGIDCSSTISSYTWTYACVSCIVIHLWSIPLGSYHVWSSGPSFCDSGHRESVWYGLVQWGCPLPGYDIWTLPHSNEEHLHRRGRGGGQRSATDRQEGSKVIHLQGWHCLTNTAGSEVFLHVCIHHLSIVCNAVMTTLYRPAIWLVEMIASLWPCLSSVCNYKVSIAHLQSSSSVSFSLSSLLHLL